MNNFKKYPLFFSLLTVLLLSFAGMLIFNLMSYSSLSTEQETYEKAKKNFNVKKSQDPTKASVGASAENVIELDAKLKELELNLSSKSGDIIKVPEITEGYELQNHLRQEIDELKELASKKDISIEYDMLFAYSRYHRKNSATPRDESIKELATQFYVLKYIIEKLYDAKIDGVELSLDEVRRESLDVEVEASDASNTGSRNRTKRPDRSFNDNDIFDIKDTMYTAKKEGSIHTYAYKLTFRTKTEVFRNFLNNLKNFDLMLVVRDVVVTDGVPIAKYGSVKSGEGGVRNIKLEEEVDETLDYSNSTPLVKDRISKFVVTIEYIEVVSKDDAEDTEDIELNEESN